MTFPLLAVADDFNRAGPGLGANWSSPIVSGDGAIVIAGSTQASYGSASYADSYWTSAPASPNVALSIVIPVRPGNTFSCGLFFRVANPNTGSMSGYLVEYTQQAGTDTVKTFKFTSGASSVIGSTINQDFSDGDSLQVTMIDATIRVYRVTGGVSSRIGTGLVDTTYAAAGYSGIEIQNTTCRLDDFAFGEPQGSLIPGRQLAMLGVG